MFFHVVFHLGKDISYTHNINQTKGGVQQLGKHPSVRTPHLYHPCS